MSGEDDGLVFGAVRRSADGGEWVDLDLLTFRRDSLEPLIRRKLSAESKAFKDRNPIVRRTRFRLTEEKRR